MAQYLELREEDCVKYMLFPNLSYSKDDQSRKDALEKCMDDYMAKLSPYLINYLWHNEPFQLKLVYNETTEMPPHLEGTTKFGDNIEDEWFITYLLLQLTKSEDDLIVKIIDNDGEFLLIEAAYYLPKWLNPETSENRVYIHRGNIHIVSNANSSDPNERLSISDAIKYIRKNRNSTKANSDIQRAIEHRIEGYPEKIKQFQHRAHCYVPASIAAILKHQPSLVAAAVQAFYLRDPIDLKACKVMKYFPPETRVMTEVTFSKCMYAQLIQQQYTPDSKVGWNLPSRNSKEFKSHDLGMKLACGFEILLAGVKKSTDDILSLADLDFNNDRRWKRFLQNLKEKDYFRGELEGSRLYQQLLKEAQSFYCENIAKSQNQTPGLKILHLLETLPINYEELKDEEGQLRPPDDDSWLEITPQELENLLIAHASMCGNDTSYSHSNEKKLPDSITTGLKSFIHHKSDIEGAEFPKLKASQKKPNRDSDNFPDAIHSILDFHVPDSDDDSSSDMSGYSDEDDMDLSTKDLTKKKAGELMQGMKEYMEQMDKELQSTDIGLSFEKLPKPSSENSNDENMPKDDQTTKLSQPSAIQQDTSELAPVDVDLTALKNILESYSCQQGLPGPASNLLSSMGICLPRNQDIE